MNSDLIYIDSYWRYRGTINDALYKYNRSLKVGLYRLAYAYVVNSNPIIQNDRNDSMSFLVNIPGGPAEGTPVRVSIHEGFYSTPTDIILELQTSLNTELLGFVVSFSDITKKISITHNQYDFIIESSELADLLGFELPARVASTTQEATILPTLSPLRSYNIQIEGTTSNRHTPQGMYSNYSLEIPVDVAVGGVISKDIARSYTQLITLTHPVKELGVRFIDDRGKAITMNSHYRLILERVLD